MAGNLEELVMENQLESDQIPLTLSWLESHSHSLKRIDAGSVGAAFQPRTTGQRKALFPSNGPLEEL